MERPPASGSDERSSAAGLAHAPLTGAAAAVGDDAVVATAEAARLALAPLAGRVPTFAVLFLSAAHAADADKAAAVLADAADTDAIIGTTAGAVLAGAGDFEDRAAVSVFVTSIPGATAHAFHAGQSDDETDDSNDGDAAAQKPGNAQDLIAAGPDTRGVILLADPFSVPVTGLLQSIDDALAAAAPPDSTPAPVIGGLASAADRPGGNAMIIGRRAIRQGFVGLTISGACALDVIVSQGCSPVGPDLIVTKAKGNMIMGLGGKPALTAIRDIAAGMDDAERERLSGGVMLGCVADEYKDRFGRGDYLIRGIVGADEDSGAIASSERVRVGQTVRLHVRDAQTSEQDLALLLDAQRLYDPPAGGLLFTCNGRGRALYNEPNKDVTLVQRAFAPPVSGEVAAKVGDEVPVGPNIPLAGFFAAGEIGPAGGKTRVHGHTACLALFRGIDR